MKYFCSKCGKPIDEDANFCKFCGHYLDKVFLKDEKTEDKVLISSDSDAEKKESPFLEKHVKNKDNTYVEVDNKRFFKFFVFVLIVLISIAAFFIVPTIKQDVNNSGGGNSYKPQLLSRNANNNDINFDISDDFSFSINSIVTPSVDINNLQLTFAFLDKNNNIITTKNKVVGNVIKNNTYTVTISLNEFGFGEILKLYSVKTQVSGGKVSYFA